MFIAIITRGIITRGNQVDAKAGLRRVVMARTRAQVVDAALSARKEMESKGAHYGPYRILVGELTTEVQTPPPVYEEILLAPWPVDEPKSEA